MLTGFGPFVAVYLTSERWTQLDIGLVLTTGTLVALVAQMPGGALVDAVRSERLLAGLAIMAIGASALALATWPIFPVVQAAAVLLAGAGCVMGPAIAAISLGLVGHAAIGERLGRNARFASLGTGFAAFAMGATGYFVSNQAVFFVTAAFVAPALLALSFIRAKEIDPETAHGGITDRNAEPHPHRAVGLGNLLRRRALVIFAACAMLFQLANAAMLPLMGSIVTMRSGQWSSTAAPAVPRQAHGHPGWLPPPTARISSACRSASTEIKDWAPRRLCNCEAPLMYAEMYAEVALWYLQLLIRK